jgi:fructose-1,6-bisphosphatase/inositol monophosphatase family enzyme
MMRTPDLAAVAAAIERIAAEIVLPRFRGLAESEIWQKSPGAYVTTVDGLAEAALEAALTELLPGSVVVGEEAAAADASVFDRIAGEEPVWIVDPVDGTYNFAHGIERFAVMAALAVRGEAVAGWIHDPVSGVTAIAERGAGATVGGRPVRVAAPVPLDRLIGIFGAGFFPQPVRGAARSLHKRVGESYTRRCAGHEYLELAEGKAHFAASFKLMPWDHAPGQLLHGEAGGHSGLIDGRPYSPMIHEGVLILAPDRGTWSEIRDILAAEGLPPGP